MAHDMGEWAYKRARINSVRIWPFNKPIPLYLVDRFGERFNASTKWYNECDVWFFRFDCLNLKEKKNNIIFIVYNLSIAHFSYSSARYLLFS